MIADFIDAVLGVAAVLAIPAIVWIVWHRTVWTADRGDDYNG